MRALVKYIENLTGEVIQIEKLSQKDLGASLPYYLLAMYSFHKMNLFDQSIVLVKLTNDEGLSIDQLAKHQTIIQDKLKKQTLFLLSDIEAYQRKRLIDKRVQFVIPEKQLFMPYAMVDLIEHFAPKYKKRASLLPSAQVILFLFLLNKNNSVRIVDQSFKQLAKQLEYSPMAISKAVNNLLDLELCVIEEQHKEKFIHFKSDKQVLWQQALPFLINPILKSVYVNDLPEHINLLKSGFSALAEYSDMNPSKQSYYAIEKSVLYGLQKANQFKNLNPFEGKYHLEVWKYNPNKLAEIAGLTKGVVDKLSLYLSLKNNNDERTEFALEALIQNLW